MAGGVDGPQARKRRFARQRAAAGQVVPRFGPKGLRRVALRVLPVVEIHPPAQVGLLFDQQINAGGPLRLARVKRPLVPFQEDKVERGGPGQAFGQKLPLGPRLVYRDIARDGLLVAARYVPPEPYRCQPVLPAVQVDPRAARRQRHAGHAELAGRVDAVRINARGAAGGQHDVGAAHGDRRAGAAVQAEQAAHAVFAGQNAENQRVIQHRHAARAHAFFQRFGHVAAGQRPGRGGPAAGVMVGLVADILAHLVGRERHAELHELEEGARRTGGFAQGDVAVHIGAAQRARHLADAVAVVPGERELVIGLFVAARVAGSAAVHALGDEQDLLPERGQAVGGVEPRAAGADDRRAGDDLFHTAHLTACAAQSRRPR